MNNSNTIAEWLLKTRYEESQVNFRTIWDLYLKFYTVFLTVNVAALAWVYNNASHISSRWPIAIAFIIQCLLAALTSAIMALQSTQAAIRTTAIVDRLSRIAESQNENWKRDDIFCIDLPVALGKYAGWANCIGVTTLGFIWLAYALRG